MSCAVCGGDLTLLGKMGRLVWFRCRDCGMDQSTEDDGSILGLLDEEEDYYVEP